MIYYAYNYYLCNKICQKGRFLASKRRDTYKIKGIEIWKN